MEGALCFLSFFPLSSFLGVEMTWRSLSISSSISCHVPITNFALLISGFSGRSRAPLSSNRRLYIPVRPLDRVRCAKLVFTTLPIPHDPVEFAEGVYVYPGVSAWRFHSLRLLPSAFSFRSLPMSTLLGVIQCTNIALRLGYLSLSRMFDSAAAAVELDWIDVARA